MTFELAATTDVLRRTPMVLQHMLGGIAERWQRANEGPDTFSPFDVVGHLIDGEETDWIPRAQIILAQGSDLTFEPYDRFRHLERNKGRSLDSLLTEFAELRNANLTRLNKWNLTESQLDLPGNHPLLGPVTLRNLFAAWLGHDLGHIAQISRVMAKQYRDYVGPWVPLMPVLTDREHHG